MIQNNIKFLRDKLEFDGDVIYTIMVLKRGKDRQENKCLRIYHLFNINDYDKICEGIPAMCDENGARAYISTTPKNLETIGLDMIINASVFIKTKQYKSLLDLFNQSFGKSKAHGKNKWLVDIDTDDVDIHNKVVEFTKEFTNVYYTNKTKSGLHIITDGFNPKAYMNNLGDIYPEAIEFVDIQKENTNTILYV